MISGDSSSHQHLVQRRGERIGVNREAAMIAGEHHDLGRADHEGGNVGSLASDRPQVMRKEELHVPLHLSHRREHLGSGIPWVTNCLFP